MNAFRVSDAVRLSANRHAFFAAPLAFGLLAPSLSAASPHSPRPDSFKRRSAVLQTVPAPSLGSDQRFPGLNLFIRQSDILQQIDDLQLQHFILSSEVETAFLTNYSDDLKTINRLVAEGKSDTPEFTKITGILSLDTAIDRLVHAQDIKLIQGRLDRYDALFPHSTDDIVMLREISRVLGRKIAVLKGREELFNTALAVADNRLATETDPKQLIAVRDWRTHLDGMARYRAQAYTDYTDLKQKADDRINPKKVH